MKKKSVLAPSLQIEHSQLYVKDLEKVTKFYKDIVGLQILERTQSQVVLGHDKTPVIELVAKPEFTFLSVPSAGLFHNAIVYSSRAELAETVYNLLQKAPDSFEGSADHLVSEAFYFHDPEFNGLELYYDRPSETWEWQNGMIKMATLYIDPVKYIQKYLTKRERISKKMGHVHLRVGDIPEAQKFYVDELGFDVTANLGSALFVSVGGYHHHLGMNTWQSRGVGIRIPGLGLGEVKIKLPQDGGIDKLANRLTGNKVKFKEKGGSLTVADPWGNELIFSD